jgi:hypothetical protein
MVDLRYLRRGVAGTVTGVVLAIGASAAFGASPAFAENGTAITGSGSSLQGTAQTFWSGLSWQGTLGNDPSVTYTSTSSGSGLGEFGDITNSDGSCDTSASLDAADSGNGSTLDGFIGSDDPATTNEICSAQDAAGGSNEEVTVPVIQAPVGVLLSLPAGITLGSGSKAYVSNQLLQQIWDHAIPGSTDYSSGNDWGALLEDAGLTKVASDPGADEFTDSDGAGDAAITLQARSSGSGTTFTFRGYLNEVGTSLGESDADNPYPLASVSDSAASGWAVTVSESGNSTGGDLVENTAGNPGSVGYANLADATKAANGGFTDEGVASTEAPVGGSASSSHYILYAQIQDDGTGTPTSDSEFADPSATPSSPLTGAANVYSGANININGDDDGAGNWTVPSGANGSWAASNGEVAAADDPDIFDDADTGVSYYPIVAVTYDDAWSDYSAGNLEADYGGATDSAEVGNTVQTYLDYIIEDASVPDQYAALPSAVKTDIEDNQLPEINIG